MWLQPSVADVFCTMEFGSLTCLHFVSNQYDISYLTCTVFPPLPHQYQGHPSFSLIQVAVMLFNAGFFWLVVAALISLFSCATSAASSTITSSAALSSSTTASIRTYTSTATGTSLQPIQTSTFCPSQGTHLLALALRVFHLALWI